MFLNKFPTNLSDYFKTLESYYGKGPLSLPEKEPCFFATGIKLFTLLHPDQAVKRYRTSTWLDLVKLFSLQLARSDHAGKEINQVSHFQVVCGQSPQSRDFGQLPCTQNSIAVRIDTISQMTDKESPILIIGDDDALSVALAKQGFKDITVFEIDAKIVESLEKNLKKIQDARIRVVQQNICDPVPADLKRNYSLVSFDPWYAMDGLRAFTEGALNASSGYKPKIVLSFNCGALLSNFLLFNEFLHQKKYKISSWLPLANTYLMPKTLHRTLEFVEFITPILSLRWTWPLKRRKQMFFSSDLLILTPVE